MTKYIHPQLNDRFAYSLFGTGGFFIEAGAGNIGDATYVLEKDFNWNGILIEPIETFVLNLKKQRQCIIDDSLLWDESNIEKTFVVCVNDLFYSSIEEVIESHKSEYIYKSSNKIQKQTTTLNDIIVKYNVTNIDYLCLDAEGSEYNILKTFNFKKVRPKLISSEDRKPHDLLIANNYREIFNPYKDKKYTWEYYYIDNLN